MQVLQDIRTLRFRPDCTRSGRFDNGVIEDGSKSHGDVVDLVSEKEEELETSAEEASSSSDASLSEEFQEEQKRGRIFLPPVPPEGLIFWQHSKLKTLQLAPPDHTRVFLCNRMMGQFHIRTGMSIRYDTPVCRVCLNASKR
jgi:hypothetical protein